MRLTIKKNDSYYSQSKDFSDLYNKLGQIEDYEEKFSIDALTLFKALENGIYVKSEIFYGNISTNTYLHKPIDSICKDCVVYEHYYEGETHYECCDFKDYGKSWALTEKELER